jgi:hypothetical protein
MCRFYVLVLFLFLASLSCKTCKKKVFNVNIQTHESIADTFSTPSSQIFFDFFIPKKVLEKKINEIFSNFSIQESYDDVFYKIKSNGYINFSFVDSVVKYEIPLQVYLSYNFNFLGTSNTINSNFDVLLKFSSILTLTQNLSVQTKTIAEGFEFTNEPVLTLGNINLPIKFILTTFLKKNLQKIAQSFDEHASNMVNISKLFAEISKDLQNEFLILSAPNLYLRMVPEKMMMGNIEFNQQYIKSTLGLIAYIETQSEKFKNFPTKQPAIIKSNLSSSFFDIYTSFFLDYDFLTEVVKNFLVNNEYVFKNGKRKIRIDHVKIYGYNKYILTDLVVSGNYSGKITLIGKPYLDKVRNELQIKEFTYHFETKNQLMKKANWLLKGSIEKKIEKRLVFPLKKIFEQQEKNLVNHLKEIAKENGCSLNLKLYDASIPKFLTLNNKIKFLIHVSGKLEVHLENIN